MNVHQRIRRARQALDMTQTDLAAKTGVHWRTVQGWESGRRPRGKAASEVERVLGIDLDSGPDSTSPRLNEATDGQLATELMSRLADRDTQIHQLHRALTEAGRPSGETPRPLSVRELA